MTAPTSPGVVPADVQALTENAVASMVALHDYAGRPAWVDCVAAAIMADRANRPSFTEDEREQVRREALEQAVCVIRCDDARMHLNVGQQPYLNRIKRGENPEAVLWDLSCAYVSAIRALADRSEPRQEKEGKA